MAMIKSSGAAPGDRRVRRSRAALQSALIGLVEERDLSQISVADVVDRADVNRSTFYAHYQDVHELAEAACTSMIDELIGLVVSLDLARANLPDSPADSVTPDPVLTAFFTHLAEHAGLYRSLLGPTGSARVIEYVRQRTTAAAHSSGYLGVTDDVPPSVAADPSGTPHDVPAAFAAGALLGVAADWLQRGCPRMPLEMAILTKPLLLILPTAAGRPPRP
ncbi:TetR/AcrR family transcriptional regulator C-terminal domain-containing protein [Streptomyces sp. NPDC004237]|uniref:TetR/AcrR family transcriptional regulator C-terminal domain-containing protein n=1 Tax=Streptomyces sp. NPDC004237 TaxID=3154455 RepID=UPI0033B4DA93